MDAPEGWYSVTPEAAPASPQVQPVSVELSEQAKGARIVVGKYRVCEASLEECRGKGRAF
jgi:hypothetical protein